MQKKIIFERGGVELAVTDRAEQDMVELATNTLWGTPGGTQYRHLDTPRRINLQSDPYFMSLRRNDSLVGFVGFSRRQLHQPAGSVESYYLRYLAMQSSLQRKEVRENNNRMRSDGMVKKFIDRTINKPEELNWKKGRATKSALFYAFVEQGNARSLEMTQSLGFRKVGSFSTLPFSRFNPIRHKRARLASNAERPHIRRQARYFYRDHALYHDCNFFEEGNYYVMTDGDRIVAGLELIPSHWVMEHMPGFSGKIITSLLPKMPGIRKLFNPNEFRFAGIEGIWHAEGYEQDLQPLLEHALADTGLHTVLIWLDQKSKLYKTVSSFSLGLLNTLSNDTPLNVVVRFQDVPEEIQEDIRSRPIYVSGFDSV